MQMHGHLPQVPPGDAHGLRRMVLFQEPLEIPHFRDEAPVHTVEILLSLARYICLHRVLGVCLLQRINTRQQLAVVVLQAGIVSREQGVLLLADLQLLFEPMNVSRAGSLHPRARISLRRFARLLLRLRQLRKQLA